LGKFVMFKVLCQGKRFLCNVVRVC